MKTLQKNRTPHGLTLIELVVVMAILAVIAMMVVPRLDFLKGQAEHASSANSQADAAAMIQTFKSSSGKYPTLDTLIGTDNAVLTKLQTQTALANLDATTIPVSGGERWYGSFSDGGFTYGYQHNQSASDASASATNAVDLVNQISDGSIKLATLKASGTSSQGTAIRTALFPGGATYITPDPDGPDNDILTTADNIVGGWTQVPAGTIPATSMIVVFGIGPKSNLVGNVMQSAPISYAGSDEPTTTYCRYLAFFEIFSDGKPAKLRMVTDHRMRQISGRVDQYRQQGAL